MPTDERKTSIKRQLALATALVAAGFVMSGLSLAEIVARGPQHLAQQNTPGTPPPQGTHAPAQSGKPAESKPGGTRPTTPAPQPARPDPRAQNEGVKPALPPAPAEKVAPPINPSEKAK